METTAEKKNGTKSISAITLLEVFDTNGEVGGYQIRVVKWVIDGRETQPSLEKRQYRYQNGEKFFAKAKGFTKDDLNVLVEKWDDISKAMGS